MPKKTKEKSELLTIPGVGPSITKDLQDLGYAKVADLKKADPEDMYETLCELRGQYIDRCVLYVFRCAVYFASNSRHQPELLKWWNWSDAALARRGTARAGASRAATSSRRRSSRPPAAPRRRASSGRR